MQTEDVIGVLDRLDAAGIEWWLDVGTAAAARTDLSHGQIGNRVVACLSLEYQFDHARGNDVVELRHRLGSPES